MSQKKAKEARRLARRLKEELTARVGARLDGQPGLSKLGAEALTERAGKLLEKEILKRIRGRDPRTP